MATRLESGPARTDMLWQAGFALVCIGWGLWSFYDWKIGYPEKNRVEAVRILEQQMGQLVPAQKPPNPLPAKPRKADFEALLKTEQRTTDEVTNVLGPPLFERTDESVNTRYYASDAGMASIPFRNGLANVSPPNWRNWYKSDDEVQIQLYMGIGCMILGLVFVYRTFRAASVRVTLDDAEMNYSGRRIPTSVMTRLTDFSPKGWVDLYYDGGAGERKLRLDNQKVARFDEIIDALCAIKGFPDPRKEAEPAEPSET